MPTAPLARWIGLTALLTILTAIVTFPQVRHFSEGANDFGDPLLNAWALAWSAHALTSADARIFDANIFYPEAGTLAYSETLLFPALIVAPLWWLGFSPLALYNVSLFAGFVGSGLTMFLLVRSLTGDWRGALVAAVAFTVAPLRIEQYGHLQLQLTYLMPLALYLVHRLMSVNAGFRPGALLGLVLGALFLSCVYYAIYFVTILPAFVGLLWWFTKPRPGWRLLVPLAAAAVATGVTVAPAASVYLHHRHSTGERSLHDVARGSAELRDYRRAQSRSLLYGSPSATAPAERSLFPGYAPPILASTAILSGTAAVPYLGALLFAFDASLGSNGHTYPALYEHARPYRALRVPARFAMMVVMFLSVLTGMGLSAALARMGSAALRRAVMAAALAATITESLNRPLELAEIPLRVPPVYSWLAGMPAGPVFEYPVSHLEGRAGPQDATYMYYSTWHWRPLLNGYSGFAPHSYFELRDAMGSFPHADSIAYLQSRHARYLLVHKRYYFRGGFDEDVAVLDEHPALRRLATFSDRHNGSTVAYEILGVRQAE